MEDPFKIPPQFDRRGEPRTKVVTPKRKWVMPTPSRVIAMQRENERVRRAVKKAEAKDMAVANRAADTAEKAAKLAKGELT